MIVGTAGLPYNSEGALDAVLAEALSHKVLETDSFC